MSAIEQLDHVDRYFSKNWLDSDFPTDEIYAALAELAELKKSREGWKLVPIEPTEEMINSAHSVEHCGNSEPHFYNAYKAMLEAYPKEPL